RDHHRRYEIRVRPRSRRRDHADRRSAHARQLTILARRSVRARPCAAEFRQTTAARLSRRRTPRWSLERRRPSAAAAAGRRRRDERALSRRLPSNHRRVAERRVERGVDLVNFAREGLSFIAIAALVAAGVFGIALVRRSWPLWLFAFALALIALW